MLIPDNLRQEHMPMMVYALCKAVKNGSYSEDELIKFLSASRVTNDEKSIAQAGNVATFAKNAGFISDEKGILTTDFSSEELDTPLDFSYAVLKRLDIEGSKKFAILLKWYLWRGTSVEAIENHTEMRKEMLEDAKIKQMNVSVDLVHGFLFWIEFLGIATPSYTTMGCYEYSIENVLINYIKDHQAELRKHGNMPAKEFFDSLSIGVCFIPLCYEKTTVCSALSYALRVIERLGIIEIEDKNDGSVTWHLEKSNSFKTGNSFTNIKVK